MSKVYKIRDSVDVYASKESDESISISFYKINTRDTTSIKTKGKDIHDIISRIDGKKSLKEIFSKHNYSKEQINNLISFLIRKGVLSEVKSYLKDDPIINRYSRQINYFDDLVDEAEGYQVQKDLISKKVMIIGCGALGGAIASHIVRAGVENLILLDPKKLTPASRQRHIYYSDLAVGKYKVEALKEYLKEINNNCNIKTFQEAILPNTDLNKLIEDNVDIVVNTADEPYIAYTSTKIARYLWDKNIPLYVSGGFDGHLTSLGEFVVPHVTPCIDCYVNTFKVAVKGIKLKYSDSNIDRQKSKKISLIGGPGGLLPQSLFSASYGSIQIVDFLIGRDFNRKYLSRRGEYYINEGKIMFMELNKRSDCKVCSNE